MPDVMVALPKCRWRPLFNAAVWLTPTTRVPCSNAAKTRKPLKFAGVPQTCQQISAVSRPKFTILRGHVEEVSLFNNFFPIVDRPTMFGRISWAGTLYVAYIFGGSCSLTEFCQLQYSLCVQVLRSPMLAALGLLHGTPAVADQSLRRGTRNGIREL